MTRKFILCSLLCNAIVIGSAHGQDVSCDATLQAPLGTAQDDQPLFRIVQGRRWGFMNRHGKVTIQPQYDGCGDFCEGLAVVVIGSTHESTEAAAKSGFENIDAADQVRVGGKSGFIDPQGKMVIPPIYDWADRFRGGLATVNLGASRQSPYTEVALGGLWGAIDKQGKVVIPVEYNFMLLFNDGLAPINNGGKQDESGQVIGGKWGFINTCGNVTIQPQFDRVSMFFDGLAIVNVGGGWHKRPRASYRNPPMFFSGGKWGFIDTSGKFVIEPQFECALRFCDGLAPVLKDGLWGYINTSGSFVIKPKYSTAKRFSEGLAYVRDEASDGVIAAYINTKGEIVIPLDHAVFGRDFSEGIGVLTMVENGTYMQAAIDAKGIMRYPFTSGLIGVCRNSLMSILYGVKFGYIDKAGNYVREPTE